MRVWLYPSILITLIVDTVHLYFFPMIMYRCPKSTTIIYPNERVKRHTTVIPSE